MFDINQVKEYLTLIITIIGLLTSTITFLLKYIKNTKIKKRLESLNQITNAIIPYIEEAEKYINYSGKEKKAYVITRIKEEMINSKINIEETLLDDKVEELVQLTKQVNYNKPVNSNNVTYIKPLKGESNG